MITLATFLVLAVCIIAIMSGVRGWPLWPAVLILGILEALKYIPGGFH